MAGVKLPPHARARLKLLVDFYVGYYPKDKIDRDTVIDWAISNLEPLDCSVVWNGKNYALQHRDCGYVAVRPRTMLRHFREGCESGESTLDIRAQAAEQDARNVEPGVLAQPEGPDELLLDIREPTSRVALGEGAAAEAAAVTTGGPVPSRSAR
jgi:hypothetical protein